MAASDRERDPAVLRLTGATKAQVLRPVAVEALMVAAGTAPSMPKRRAPGMRRPVSRCAPTEASRTTVPGLVTRLASQCTPTRGPGTPCAPASAAASLCPVVMSALPRVEVQVRCPAYGLRAPGSGLRAPMKSPAVMTRPAKVRGDPLGRPTSPVRPAPGARPARLRGGPRRCTGTPPGGASPR
ncbi:MAG TPA: hypothetical protein VN520_10655 [Streptomyces sp.]|uniref:hypothetical protein n=1 Tax=Streptomyces sp. TaxID=1931 RepID=UPI002C28FE54|nr:hypothetical protein [Streptomyces sp.]HWU06825.1 hypothetical protein [Streptomyces sp.]